MVAKKAANTAPKKSSKSKEEKWNHPYRGKNVTPLTPSQIATISGWVKEIGTRKTNGIILVCKTERTPKGTAVTGSIYIHNVNESERAQIAIGHLDISPSAAFLASLEAIHKHD